MSGKDKEEGKKTRGRLVPVRVFEADDTDWDDFPSEAEEEPVRLFRRRRRNPLGDDDHAVPRSFGAYLGRLRKERGLSLRDAAVEIGISHGYLSQIETGKKQPRPSLSLMQRIAVAYGRPTKEVLAEAGMQPKAVEGRNVLIERAFRSIVLHPELAPLGMDAKYWLDSFSTRQKLQWIEFAQKLARWKPAEADETHDKEILEVLNAFAVAADDEEGVH